jgi:uncharacterized membrane protein YhhN
LPDATVASIAQVVIVAAVCAAVVALVAAESAGRRVRAFVCKTAASAGFVVLALVRADASRPFDRWVLVALVLCLAGDLLLAAPRGVPAGLASFALAHVGYIAAFSTLAAPGGWPPLVLTGVAAGIWLWPHLGTLRPAVVAYIAVIGAMTWGAISVAGHAGWTVGVAGVLFYVSDLAVARDRFVVGRFASRAWGLPAYYAAQVLFALALGR